MDGQRIEEVRLVLSTPNKAARERVYTLLKEHLKAPNDSPDLDQRRTIRLNDIDKTDVLGAFEPVFVIAMGVSIVLSSSGVGLWCLAHQQKGGGRIALESAEGRMLVDTITAAQQGPPADSPSASGDAAQ
jgi:hypothetical protein